MGEHEEWTDPQKDPPAISSIRGAKKHVDKSPSLRGYRATREGETDAAGSKSSVPREVDAEVGSLQECLTHGRGGATYWRTESAAAVTLHGAVSRAWCYGAMTWKAMTSIAMHTNGRPIKPARVILRSLEDSNRWANRWNSGAPANVRRLRLTMNSRGTQTIIIVQWIELEGGWRASASIAAPRIHSDDPQSKTSTVFVCVTASSIAFAAAAFPLRSTL
jgi:hypothetical protein